MKKSKITINGIIIESTIEDGYEYTQLCDELAEEADDLRIRWQRNKK